MHRCHVGLLVKLRFQLPATGGAECTETSGSMDKRDLPALATSQTVFLAGVLLLVACSLQTPVAQQLSPGPSAFWAFDECDGQTAVDSVQAVNGILGAQATTMECPARPGVYTSCTLSVSSNMCCTLSVSSNMCGARGGALCDDVTQGAVMSVWPVPSAIRFDNRKQFSVTAWVSAANYGDIGTTIVGRFYGGDQFGLMMGRAGTYDVSSATFLWPSSAKQPKAQVARISSMVCHLRCMVVKYL